MPTYRASKSLPPQHPTDAKGLLKSAIREDNVVVMFEHKAIYSMRGPVPEGEYLVPIGVADVKREGSDVSVITYARQTHNALEAAEQLAAEGISVEVVDIRSLYPLDTDTVLRSVRKTHRAVVLYEAVRFGGFGAEIASQIQELGLRRSGRARAARWRGACARAVLRAPGAGLVPGYGPGRGGYPPVASRRLLDRWLQPSECP